MYLMGDICSFQFVLKCSTSLDVEFEIICLRNLFIVLIVPEIKIVIEREYIVYVQNLPSSFIEINIVRARFIQRNISQRIICGGRKKLSVYNIHVYR